MERTYVFIGDIEVQLAKIQACPLQFARLAKECDAVLAVEIPLVHPFQSITYMGLNILNLALMHLLTGSNTSREGALAWMRAVCGYPHWGSDKKTEDIDLSASWVLFGLALGYDWLYNQMDARDRILFQQTIEQRAQILLDYRNATEGHTWSTEYWQNHNWINMTGVAAAGYALEAHNCDGKRFIEASRDNFSRVFAGLADDGSNYEGVAYWRYGGMWLFVYAWLLLVQEGVDLFSSSDYLRNTFWYRLYQAAPDLAQQVNFGDTHDRRSGHAVCVYHLVARMYRNGYAQALAGIVLQEFLESEATESKVRPGILPEAGLEYIWFDQSVALRALDDLPLVRCFEDLGLVAVRSSWDRDGRMVSFKCGSPGGKKQWEAAWSINRTHGWQCMSLSHHHPDNLAYSIVQGSRFFTCDDGYNRSIMPYHHNVLLVDGQLSDAQGVSDVYLASCALRLARDPAFLPERTYLGTLEYLHAEGSLVWFSGESALIYPVDLGMHRVSRFVFTDGLRYVLCIDQFASATEHEYAILCNTDEEPEKGPGTWFSYPHSAIRLSVVSDKPCTWRKDSHTVRSIMTPQEPDKVCTTTMQHLIHESEGPGRRQLFAELFAWEDGIAVNFEQGDLVLRDGKAIHRFSGAGMPGETCDDAAPFPRILQSTGPVGTRVRELSTGEVL